MKPTKPFARKAGRIVLLVFSLLIVCILILTGTLLACSPGQVKPFLNEDGTQLPGSITEKTKVTINGVDQGLFIVGKNQNNPVLLFLHGGPGMPEYFLAEKYPSGLEDYFTVCYWEHRGAGLSYNKDIPTETMTVEQIILDTLEVTKYLQKRFGQEKITLLAHSGGSFFGIRAAARAPELYNAYIGIGQITKQAESEKESYTYMLEQYTAAGNTKMARKLQEYPIFESDTALQAYRTSMVREDAMHKLGVGTMRNMDSVIKGIFLPVMQCRAYTLKEKINIWRGKAFSQKRLRDKIDATDLTADVPSLAIPAYFLHGAYDYTVSKSLAMDYFKTLQAPVKGFYTFEQSAHSPLFEEPEKFLSIMIKDVLSGRTALADRS